MTFNGKEELYRLMTRDKNNEEWERCTERIKSFMIRRNNNGRHVKNQDIYILACAGFECRDDYIRCAYCLKILEIEDEEPKMNLHQLLEKHKAIEEECKYLIPYMQKPEHMSMQRSEERRKSFDKKKIHEDFSRISLEDLICMGLFYKEDTIAYLVCYQCGKEIEYDELDRHKAIESLWKMHANHKRYCSRVILHRGISYQERYQPTNDADKEEKRIRMLVNEAYREARETAKYVKKLKIKIE